MNSLRKLLVAFDALIFLLSPLFIHCHHCGVCSQENLAQDLSSPLSREQRNQAIKSFFMKKLNRTDDDSPSINVSAEVLANAKIQYEELMKKKNPVVATIVHEIPGTESPPHHISSDRWHYCLQNHSFRYYFPFKRGGRFYPQSEQLVTAKLILNVPAISRSLTDLDFPGKIRLDVYQIVGFPESDRRARKRLVDSHVIPFGENRTVHFHFHEVVSYWQKYPRENFGIEIIIDSSQFSQTTQDVSFFEGSQTLSALLRLENGVSSRRRRSSRTEASCRSSRGLCCKFPHRVNFTEIGLDWVVHPILYTTHQCTGNCPESNIWSLAVNDVAVVRSSLHKLNESVHPPPCCVPKRLSNLTILYMKDGNPPVLDIAEFADLVVNECGCA